MYAASIMILLASKMGHGWGFVDLAVYRYGAQGVLDGTHLYALRFPGALAFTYPPIAALLFLPLTFVRMAVLGPVVTAGSIVLLPVAPCARDDAETRRRASPSAPSARCSSRRSPGRIIGFWRFPRSCCSRSVLGAQGHAPA
jgi:hypothetical protein